MEEILASIRRIISEDETPAEAEAAPEAAAPAPLPTPPQPAPPAPELDIEPYAAHAEEDDVLELTDRIEAPAETHGDIDVYARAPEPASEPAAWRGHEEEPLVGPAASESAASAFGALSRTIAMPHDGRTLEDVVRELLRPLLKAWLDENLPQIVQARVDAEVERIARTPRR